MKRTLLIVSFFLSSLALSLAQTVRFGNGTLKVTTVAHNAVRVQYTEGTQKEEPLPTGFT